MKYLALFLAVVLALSLPAWADAPLVTYAGSLAAPTTTAVLSLAGQSTCSVVFGGTHGSVSGTVQSSSDSGATWNTVTTIGTAGVITANGTYTGSIAGISTAGLLRFRVNVATMASGTLTYVETCSGAVGAPGSSGGTSSATIVSPLTAAGAVETALCDKTTVTNCAIVDTNGTQATKVCDKTTSTQCVTVDTNGHAYITICSSVNANCVNTNTLPVASDAIASGSGTGISVASYIGAYNGTTSDRVRKDVYAAGPLWATSGGSATTAIAAGAGTTVVKGTPGRVARGLITASGSAGALTCYDNASTGSGTIIAIFPGATSVATAVTGTSQEFDTPAANGITCVGAVGSPAVTISWF